MSAGRRLRCAIYTRRSSEEEIQREFNSLEAQRDACEAYVQSQVHDGWTCLPEPFNDGGYSGGNLDRPAFKSLLAMIEGAAIDVVVVYKIDRLTRSLLDFARIAELFRRQKVSLVSVTQQFDTSTSIGQLTLNVLLSFAQFEREIASERIREKIAASKSRGMWMGGMPPIGYEAVGGELVINRYEAGIVRRIFELYLEEETVSRLARRLRFENIRTAPRHSAHGEPHGGRPFSRGHLQALLSSPIYVGRVPHKKASYPGRHEPVIDRQTWEAVQAQIATNVEEINRRARAASTRPVLSGLLVSPRGRSFHHVHARKGHRRYRYYVEQVSAPQAPLRLSAPEFEATVADAMRRLLRDHARIIDQLGGLAPDQVPLSTTALRLMRRRLTSASALTLDRTVLRRVQYHGDRLVLTVSVDALRKLIGLHCSVGERTVDFEVRIPPPAPKPGRRRMKLIVAEHEAPQPDLALVRAVVRARAWADKLISGEAASIAELSRTAGFGEAYVRKLLPLAFLPPSTVEQILRGDCLHSADHNFRGTEPAELRSEKLGIT